MLPLFALVSLLPFLLAGASSASSFAGATTSDVFTATATGPDTSDFPSASVVGYAGPTPTGNEPFAIESDLGAPTKSDIYPLQYPQVLVGSQPKTSPSFNPARYWGNLSPWFSVDSAANGLPGASARIPSGCNLKQTHMLQRHGARYPAADDPPSQFANALHSAANSTGVTASGPLAFLNTWKFELGAELLTPFGEQQLFERGSTFRVLYGKLLDGFTQPPVFRTTSEERMVDSAINFAAGFFGVQNYQNSFNLEIEIEEYPFNNTLAPWQNCLPNGDTYYVLGNQAIDAWVDVYLKDTVKRLQPSLKGVNLTASIVYAMQNLCPFETVALGSSEFCGLFTQQEWEGFEYALDLYFWYGNGPGNPVTAAQGIGYVQELLARLTQTTPLADTSINATLDDNPTTFPVNQPMYFDFTHDTVISVILSAMNLTSFNTAGPLPLTHIPANNAYHVAQIAPFASQLLGQVLECPASLKNATLVPSIRWILNDGVVPLTGIKQCASHKNADGLCPLDSFVAGIQELVADEDWTYDCTANYTSTPGVPNTITNGKPPRH
ncbi:phosphoglycerate mutase-like protein [Cytidiella melzeri]|nr:phosphoglycerate mutase-like protein [Cytidiella melzeri]